MSWRVSLSPVTGEVILDGFGPCWVCDDAGYSGLVEDGQLPVELFPFFNGSGGPELEDLASEGVGGTQCDSIVFFGVHDEKKGGGCHGFSFCGVNRRRAWQP